LGAIGVAPDDGEQERLAEAVVTLSACLVTGLSFVLGQSPRISPVRDA